MNEETKTKQTAFGVWYDADEEKPQNDYVVLICDCHYNYRTAYWTAYDGHWVDLDNGNLYYDDGTVLFWMVIPQVPYKEW